MNKIRVPGNQNEGADVGIGVGALDAIGGHLDVDAVLHPGGSKRGGAGPAVVKACGHIYGFDTGGIEGRGIVDELAGAPEFGGPGDPVCVGFGHHHPAVVRYFFLQ